MAMLTEYPVGLRDGKCYALTLPSTYASGTDIPAFKSGEFTPTYTTAMAEGDDEIVSTFAVLRGGELSIEQSTAMSLTQIAVMLGGSTANSGTTPTSLSYYTGKVSNRIPYWGFIGMAIDAESAGSHHLLLPKCKVSSGPDGAYSYGNYKPVNWKAEVLKGQTSSPYVFRFINHETETAIPSAFPGDDIY